MTKRKLSLVGGGGNICIESDKTNKKIDGHCDCLSLQVIGHDKSMIRWICFSGVTIDLGAQILA